MRDRPVIAIGVVLFLAIATLPVWRAASSGTKASAPEVKRPPVEVQQCVEPKAFMRTSHMKLLVNWREQVVRRGATTYVASDGRQYPISLTKTCMSCHKSKSEFCDRCHEYEAVAMNCFECHVDSASPGAIRLARLRAPLPRYESRFGEAGPSLRSGR